MDNQEVDFSETESNNAVNQTEVDETMSSALPEISSNRPEEEEALNADQVKALQDEIDRLKNELQATTTKAKKKSSKTPTKKKSKDSKSSKRNTDDFMSAKNRRLLVEAAPQRPRRIIVEDPFQYSYAEDDFDEHMAFPRHSFAQYQPPPPYPVMRRPTVRRMYR